MYIVCNSILDVHNSIAVEIFKIFLQIYKDCYRLLERYRLWGHWIMVTQVWKLRITWKVITKQRKVNFYTLIRIRKLKFSSDVSKRNSVMP